MRIVSPFDHLAFLERAWIDEANALHGKAVCVCFATVGIDHRLARIVNKQARLHRITIFLRLKATASKPLTDLQLQ